jgi:hypothetical protein
MTLPRSRSRLLGASHLVAYFPLEQLPFESQSAGWYPTKIPGLCVV